MAIPTLRAPASQTKGLCFSCHGQILEALTPKEFMKNGRAGDDEGYWIVSIAVDRCEACAPPLGERVYRSACDFFGYDSNVVFDIALTALQYGEAMTSTSVGAVSLAPARAHNANIQLANMRGNSVVKDDIGDDTLYKSAMFQIWPFVTALLSSDMADQSVFSRGWCCCSGRNAVLRGSKFIALRKSKRELAPPLEPVVTAEEQIFGESQVAGATNIPYVTLQFDEMVKETLGTPMPEDSLAVKYGPTTKDKVFYENSAANVRRAVKERIDDKYVEFNMTTEEREQLSYITDEFCEELRNSTQIEKIASWLLFGDIKSQKWSLTRAEMALNVLMWTLNPDFDFSAAIKLEPMGKGKPPRMLIADGDAGAVMSALTIGCLERYICRYYKYQTIKGKPKSDRMSEICREAFEMANASEAHRAFMMENDGSAWDTCCKLVLRDLTENKILDVMYDKLYVFFTPYNWFQHARKKADSKKHYKLNMNLNKVNIERLQAGYQYTQEDLAKALCKRRANVCIESIRRSGDRGTSILNWIVNKICWAWVLGGSRGRELMRANAKLFVDIFGTRRRFKSWFEGDDSLKWLTGRIFLEAELLTLTNRWIQLGMRPKLFLRAAGDQAEFCGWKIMVDDYGLVESTAVPDIPRLLSNCFYSTDKAAIAAANDGDEIAFARAVGPAIVARAGSIADRVPTIAHWLTRVARDMGDAKIADEMFSRDDLFRMGNGDRIELIPEWWKNDDPELLLDTRFGLFVDNVHQRISNSIATGGLGREAELAVRHGWVRTSAEWFAFASALDHVTVYTSDSLYRSLLPPGLE